jgi:leucyl aminopeptidase
VNIAFELARQAPEDLEVLAVPVCSDRFGDEDSPLDWGFLRARGFDGRAGQIQSLPGDLSVVVLAVGLGSADGVDAATMRRAGAAVARASRRSQVLATTLLDAAPEDADRSALATALVEGVALASYSFDAHKSEPDPSRLERVVVIGTGGQRFQKILDRAAAVAGGALLARDLVNEPGGTLTPQVLAERAVAAAGAAGVRVEVLDEKAIAHERLGGLLGVNRGSVEPPRFIRLTWEPEGRSRGTVALVGKGITFDSGGLSIKTSEGMTLMKNDMGGAAAVIGAFSTFGVVAPKVRVEGYVPATDNMINGEATRPGDVLIIRNTKTVEVLNTDAEGRLILADALSMASEHEPDAIVDVATLTGAQEVALGKRVAGLMGNHEDLIAQVRAAGERTGETAWPMPLPGEYRRQLDSEVADLRNIGAGRAAGMLTAGLFLQEFVASGIAWAHLDIAGPAWADGADGHLVKGGTGFGVRLLVDLVEHFRRPSAR